MRGYSLAALALLAACGSPAPAPEATQPSAAIASAAAAAAATATAAPEQWEKLQAVGTEPFWSVEIQTGQLRYSTPESIEGTTFPATRRSEGPRVIFSGTLEGQPFTLTLEPATCSDGMSDTVYPFAATRSIGTDMQRGCARNKIEAGPS